MEQYSNILRDILKNGVKIENERTGTGTLSLFGTQSRYRMTEGFPILTLRKLGIKVAKAELLWMLSGSTDNRELQALGTEIWTPWALKTGTVITKHGQQPEAYICEPGDLGPVYGQQWRGWSKAPFEYSDVDQMAELVENLKKHPFSRRHVVSAWNPTVLPDESLSHDENIKAGRAVLPPCHTVFQFVVRPAGELDKIRWTNYVRQTGIELTKVPEYTLSCQLYARSQDFPVGTPFNIMFYSMLTHMLASTLGYIPLDYIHSTGDSHIYLNQVDAVQEMLKRNHRPLPKLWVNPEVKSIFDFKMDDIELVNYNPHPAMKFQVSV